MAVDSARFRKIPQLLVCKCEIVGNNGFCTDYEPKEKKTMIYNKDNEQVENLDGEVWKDVPGYEGQYQVSNLGRVKSLDRYILRKDGRKVFRVGQILRLHNTGYENWKGGRYKKVSLNGKELAVHRLVALAFIPNINGLPFINHKDENPSNNRVDNLEWCDYHYNNTYGTRVRRITDKLCMAVNQYNLSGEFIRQHRSINDAARTLNVSPSPINRVCKGNADYAFGFLWRYADRAKDVLRENNIQRRKMIKTTHYKRISVLFGKRIGQFSTNGELIATFDSAHDASTKTGVYIGNIRKSCYGVRLVANGYMWRFIDADNRPITSEK